MGIGIWQLVIILLIVLLLFGAKRLRNIGGDLGSAVKGFRTAIKDEDKDKSEAQIEQRESEVIEGEVTETKVGAEKDKV